MQRWKANLLELAPTQIYISDGKLRRVQEWLTPETVEKANIIFPVQNFGDGKWAITDGHTRALRLYQLGIQQVEVELDTCDIVMNGWRLYQQDRRWCERYGLHSIADMADRIVSEEDYRRLWMGRCDKLYDLIYSEYDFQKIQALRPDLFLYGADETYFYFEDQNLNTIQIPIQERKQSNV